MKQQLVKITLSLAAAVALTQAALAADGLSDGADHAATAAHSEQALLLRAFEGAELSSAQILDLPAMRDTRGELWPFILGVASFDLALSSYFWGVYVPTVTGGGGCVTCSYTMTVAHH